MNYTMKNSLLILTAVTASATLLSFETSARAQGDEVSYSTEAAKQTLFEKYGGEATIQKVVDDAAAGVMADPVVGPYFGVVGKAGHDTGDRLKSCLDLQFTVLFGGPGKYPGISHYRNAPREGYMCQSMRAIHKGLNIPTAVFNKFVTDLAMVLKADGVSAADIKAVAPALIGLERAVDVKGPQRRPHTRAGTVGRTMDDLNGVQQNVPDQTAE